jgi:MYXO-CTERM domain-containing protein
MRALAYLLVCIVLLMPEQAKPCSPAPCSQGGHLLPQVFFPARLHGFLWTPRQGYGAGVEVAEEDVLLQTTNGIEVPVTLEPYGTGRTTYLIVPTMPLAAGTNYQLHVPSTCSELGFETLSYALEAKAEAPLPTELGTLMVEGSRLGPLMVSSGGSCSVTIDAAQVDVQVVLSAEAEPWANAFLYRTIVDGRPWSPTASLVSNVPLGYSWEGHGRDRLYASCGGEAALSEGRHEVIIEATLPGRTEVLRTPPLMIELSCDSGANGGGLATVDAGCDCNSGGESNSAGALLLVALMFFFRRR